MRTLQDLYHVVPLADRNSTHSVPTRSDNWLKDYLFFCTVVPQASTFKLLATGCYRHADTVRRIQLDSCWRADFNETLPASGGHLPPEVSVFFILLTSIAIPTLRNLYHSIPCHRRIATHPVPMLSDNYLNGYGYRGT